MQRVQKVGHRTAIAAAIAAIVAVAWSASALALPAYSVHVNVVPSTLPVNMTFTVTAHGNSSNTSLLKVLLNRKSGCAHTAAQDAAHPGDSLKIDTMVTGAYSRSKTFTAKQGGRHWACAYLTSLPPSHFLRARADMAYLVD